MNKYQAAQRIRNLIEKRIPDYEHVDGLADIMVEYESMLIGNNSVLEKLHFQEFDDGEFYLGIMANRQREGLGIVYFDNGNFYIGEFSDDAYNGKGFFVQTDDCYYGDFLNGKRHGEGIIVGKNGLYVNAIFEQDEITSVKQTASGFTYDGKKYDENGKKTDDGNGCMGCVSIGFVIALLLGVYDYCSSWLETQKHDDAPQTELYEATTTYVCTASKSLKVRTAPDVSAVQIGSLMAGEEVEVYSISDGFARIRFRGKVGYASIKYLRQK